jgi:hypothetical protein
MRAVLAVAATAVAIMACGSEPKMEPTASTATASVAPPPVPAVPEAGAPGAASTADAGAAKPDKAAECDALVDEANQTLDAERIAVDKACKKDSDCMPVKARACAFNCANAAIPKSEEKDWTEAMTKVKDGACKKWTDNECAKLKTKPQPACQDKKVWCDKGHCALK